MKYFKLITLIPFLLVACRAHWTDGPQGDGAGDNSSNSSNSSNNTPSAVDDNAIVTENSVVIVNVLANDSDADNDIISIVSASIPNNGIAFLVNGQIEYTPFANYVGADSFTYVIEDTFAAQATATVFLDVVDAVVTGSLTSWGWDADWYGDILGQVTDTPTGNDFTQVAAGSFHSVALRSDGSLFSWGADYSLQVTDTPAGNDFTQVAAGGGHSIALRANGSLAPWGYDAYGQVADTPAGNDFIQVAAGLGHSVAISF
jgi:uncharacterized protein YcfL